MPERTPLPGGVFRVWYGFQTSPMPWETGNGNPGLRPGMRRCGAQARQLNASGGRSQSAFQRMSPYLPGIRHA